MSNKSDVQKLYAEYGDKICLAPFFNNFYTTNNVVTPGSAGFNQLKPCTVIKHNRAGSQFNWNIQDNSLLETRNNSNWKRLRQSFLEGRFETIEECRSCSQAERLGASSARLANNEYLFEHLDVDIMAEMRRIVDNALTVDHMYALDYMPSNYCNYACVMCAAGASSQRLTFEVKNGAVAKYVVNEPDADFLESLKHVKILGFTGGETILQPEVHKLMDWLIETGLSTNMVITMLTNASNFPNSIIRRFEKFKRVLYTVSIDGVGDVIEYQRRGCDWNKVQDNARKIHATPVVHEMINHVVTSINILSAMDFIDWCHDNDFKFISISAVYQQRLSLAAMPDELRELALSRLRAGRQRYEHYADPRYIPNYECNWLRAIDDLINTVENSQFNPNALQQFIKHIRLEDTASKKPLHAVVPEWAPWFV